jgi:hypothetical protein
MVWRGLAAFARIHKTFGWTIVTWRPRDEDAGWRCPNLNGGKISEVGASEAKPDDKQSVSVRAEARTSDYSGKFKI